MKEKQRLPTFSAIFKNKKQSADALCKDGSAEHPGNDDEQRLADNAGDGSGTDGNDNKVSLHLKFQTILCFYNGWFCVARPI